MLAEWLKLEPHVLRFGETVSKAVRAGRKRWDEGLGYLERETFDAFLALPASQRKALREIIMSLAETPATGTPPVAKKRVKDKSSLALNRSSWRRFRPDGLPAA